MSCIGSSGCLSRAASFSFTSFRCCRHCGMPYQDDDEQVPEALRGALVFLLDEMARQYDMPPCDKPDGCCNRCERRDDVVYANGLAQIINGGGRG